MASQCKPERIGHKGKKERDRGGWACRSVPRASLSGSGGDFPRREEVALGLTPGCVLHPGAEAEAGVWRSRLGPVTSILQLLRARPYGSQAQGLITFLHSLSSTSVSAMPRGGAGRGSPPPGGSQRGPREVGLDTEPYGVPAAVTPPRIKRSPSKAGLLDWGWVGTRGGLEGSKSQDPTSHPGGDHQSPAVPGHGCLMAGGPSPD